MKASLYIFFSAFFIIFSDLATGQLPKQLAVAAAAVDVVDTEADMAWYYERFGHSTFYDQTKMNVESFTTEEYLKLISTFQNRSKDRSDPSYYAIYALHLSILTHLEKNPNDPKYQDIKNKLVSPAFVKSLAAWTYHSEPYALFSTLKLTDRQLMLELLPINGYTLMMGVDAFRDDKELVLVALNSKGRALRYASERLKDDKDVVLAAIKEEPDAVQYASDRLKNDKTVALAAVGTGEPFKYLSSAMRSDTDVTRIALIRDPEVLQYAIDPGRDFVLKAVKGARYPGSVMPYIPYKFTSDEEILEAGFTGGYRSASRSAYMQFGKIALITDDEVRVRNEPGRQGKYAGVLYTNMIVEVLAESETREDIGGDSFHWYNIKSEEIEGWIYGKFVNFYVPNKNVDSYLIPGRSDEYGLGWFYDRFPDGSSTDSQDLTDASFTVNQYRTLIQIAGRDWRGIRAKKLLLKTIFARLKEQPDDPKYAYLKKKLYSTEFLEKMFGKQYIPEYIRKELDKEGGNP